MDPKRVDVVLVRPARGANVASACRAMKNMGLGRLLLVSGPPLDRPEDRALAYGAWDLLDSAQRHASLADAVADNTFVVGTSGRAGSEAWTPRRLAQEGGLRAAGGRTAVVFGPEASGLSRAELSLCHVVVQVPTAPEQPSLNLAQAVLVLAYEILLSTRPDSAVEPERAPAGELEACLQALDRGLLAIGYLNPQDPGRILAELRRLLARAGPTPRELTLLRGLARQLEWAGSVASRQGVSG